MYCFRSQGQCLITSIRTVQYILGCVFTQDNTWTIGKHRGWQAFARSFNSVLPGHLRVLSVPTTATTGLAPMPLLYLVCATYRTQRPMKSKVQSISPIRLILDGDKKKGKEFATGCSSPPRSIYPPPPLPTGFKFCDFM